MFPYLYFPNKTWKHFKTYYYEKIILHKYLWFHLYWNKIILNYVTFYPFMNESVVVQLLSPVQLFATPWTAALQAPLSSTISWSLLRFISIELVMLSNHLILYCPLLLLPPSSPASRFFHWVSSSHQVAKLLGLQFQCLLQVWFNVLSFDIPLLLEKITDTREPSQYHLRFFFNRLLLRTVLELNVKIHIYPMCFPDKHLLLMIHLL